VLVSVGDCANSIDTATPTDAIDCAWRRDLRAHAVWSCAQDPRDQAGETFKCNGDLGCPPFRRFALGLTFCLIALAAAKAAAGTFSAAS
jgi:hypothetical protein